MIGNFADHSANERTFLVWVRTAIAVMAFGFIVEKFELFLEVAALSLVGRPVVAARAQIRRSRIGALCSQHCDGRRRGYPLSDHRKNIDSEQQHPTMGSRIDIALAARHARQRPIRLFLVRSGHKAVTPATRQLARAHIAHFASRRRIDNSSCRRSVLVFG
jgi:putative membrane protein